MPLRISDTQHLSACSAISGGMANIASSSSIIGTHDSDMHVDIPLHGHSPCRQTFQVKILSVNEICTL